MNWLDRCKERPRAREIRQDLRRLTESLAVSHKRSLISSSYIPNRTLSLANETQRDYFDMFRTAIYRSAGAFPRLAVSKTISTSLAARPSSLFRPSQFAVSRSIPTFRCYSAPAGLGKPEVEGRIIDLLKNFDKVCPNLGTSRTTKLTRLRSTTPRR